MIPKLNSLSPTDKIHLAAELDGWTLHPSHDDFSGKACPEYWTDDNDEVYWDDNGMLPPYATSYDAIIPLIQKQNEDVRCETYKEACKMNHLDLCGYKVADWWTITPSQLLDALLVATGKATI